MFHWKNKSLYNTTWYAKEFGFGVIRRSSKSGHDEKHKYVILACVHQDRFLSTASNILKPIPIGRFGCKTKIYATIWHDRGFCLFCVVLEHAHILSPINARFIGCHRKLDEDSKSRLQYYDMAGIVLSKNCKSFVVEAKDYENLTFDDGNAHNYIHEERLLNRRIKGFFSYD